jgi:hypothetical protein
MRDKGIVEPLQRVRLVVAQHDESVTVIIEEGM